MKRKGWWLAVLAMVVWSLGSGSALGGNVTVKGDAKIEGDLRLETSGKALVFPDGTRQTSAGAVFRRTVVAGPVGTALENGTALLNALTGITDAEETRPCLLKLEPGIYDLGEDTLQMIPFVDVEGSGEAVTRIVSAAVYGVVAGAPDCELRLLSVENSGNTSDASAVYSKDLNTMQHTPFTVSFVSALCRSSANNCFAFYNQNAPLILRHVRARATGAGDGCCYGVYNDGADVQLQEVQSEADGAVYVSNGSGKGYALFNINGSVVKVFGGSFEAGRNDLGNYGAFNSAASCLWLFDARLEGGPVAGWGLLNASTGGEVLVDHSTLYGATDAVRNDNAQYPVRVGASRIAGIASGNVTCAGVYDTSFSFYSNTCP